MAFLVFAIRAIKKRSWEKQAVISFTVIGLAAGIYSLWVVKTIINKQKSEIQKEGRKKSDIYFVYLLKEEARQKSLSG